uniref:DUF2723 domain-containing protein n=1 Tax=Polaribacter sp. TaxID=1920175 RepID=UPI004048971C
MTAANYKKWDSITGWIIFAIALITYTLTLEPTVSAWDCGEYISTSVKLEVGHPPGAPLFQMLGAFFAMFTSELTEIAKMVNLMSAIASAFTILFMFWTITNLAKKLIKSEEEYSMANTIAVLGSGIVGALAYTFSDSFWFSAVEGEVYAMSSFLMALLFWLGLKWENEMKTPRGNRWFIVICFVVGLSFGVHILSLLVIPAVVMLYFFKMYNNITIKTTAIATIIATLILAFVFKFLFPFTLQFFSSVELFFVNSLGMPFNTGSIIAGLLLVGLFYYGLKRTRKKQQLLANTLILGVLFIMIGFSSWIMLPIRANANTTINENNPSSARELLAYYNREQYGDANVFYDTYYSITYGRRELDKSQPYKDDKPKYEKDEAQGKYVIVNDYKNKIPNYSSTHKGFIPRMVDPDREQNYKSIAGIPANSKRRPTFSENLKFMFSFQFGCMYGRYFMWNFVGRQNDNQGQLDIFNGNWLSGVKFIDEARLGSQSNLPDDVKNNKGRNTYYFLPLILGLIGLFYQIKFDKKNTYSLFLFFAFTGFAVIFYTNPKSFEVRERDYAIVGSFYIFAIWIGLGVFALFEYLKKYGNRKTAAIGVTVLSFLAVPALMASENWDDHDRSNRYTTHLNALTYLESCDPNAIMFTIGDNDTFPLWYMQEVEGVRRDIKLINTSLFATDWYIDQMKRATYEAPPIPSQLTHDKYKVGSLDVAYHLPHPQFKDSVISIDNFMKWIESDNKVTYYTTEDGEKLKTYPTNKIRIPVNKENVLKSGIVKAEDADKIVDYIDITINDTAIPKNRILMLDILANNDWKQPIYFTGGANDDAEYIWLKDYLQLDGVAYKLVPIFTSNENKTMLDMGRIDSEKLYDFIQNVDWRNSNDGKIYLDEQTKRSSISIRNNMMRLAETFINEKDYKKAKEILDLSLDKMPLNQYEYYTMVIDYPRLYYKLGEKEKAREITAQLIEVYQQKLRWYSTFDTSFYNTIGDEIESSLQIYKRWILDPVTRNDPDTTYTKKLEADFMNTVKLFEHLIAEEE